MWNDTDEERMLGEGCVNEPREKLNLPHTCYLDVAKQRFEHSRYRKGMCKAADYTGEMHRTFFTSPSIDSDTTCDCVLDETIRDLQDKVKVAEAARIAAEDAKKEALDNMNTVVTSLRKVSAELIIERGRTARSKLTTGRGDGAFKMPEEK